MKIFYYTWYENSEEDMAEALIRLGHCVVKCHIPITNYENDDVFATNLVKIFIENKCDIFISFNFFPLIARCAEALEVKYIAWVYDCPHWTLYSPAAESKGTYLFLFDRLQYDELKNLGLNNIYHLPLPVNSIRLNSLLGDELEKIEYQYDISFVGSLYEKNMYQQISYLPEEIRGYIDGISNAQKEIYGYNIISEVLDEALELEISKYVDLDIDKSHRMNRKQIYVDMINSKISSEERVELLRCLGKYHSVTLFSNSNPQLVPEVIPGGIVTYNKQMPRVFRNSKINLNITIRSIQSGIPLRVLDIMGAGGFLISNYQQELVDYFEVGKEVILFQSKEELLYYSDYYLNHEEERKEIAYNGWKKVSENFSYEILLNKIFDVLDGKCI